jgi:hypothetical protein
MTLDDSNDSDFPTRNSRAEAISRQYGALYEEVAAWFDAGYPAAEIERAYRLGKEQECDASDIFAMLDAGMDWRDIAKALDPMPDTGSEDDSSDDVRTNRPRRPRRRN